MRTIKYIIKATCPFDTCYYDRERSIMTLQCITDCKLSGIQYKTTSMKKYDKEE